MLQSPTWDPTCATALQVLQTLQVATYPYVGRPGFADVAFCAILGGLDLADKLDITSTHGAKANADRRGSMLAPMISSTGERDFPESTIERACDHTFLGLPAVVAPSPVPATRDTGPDDSRLTRLGVDSFRQLVLENLTRVLKYLLDVLPGM